MAFPVDYIFTIQQSMCGFQLLQIMFQNFSEISPVTQFLSKYPPFGVSITNIVLQMRWMT